VKYVDVSCSQIGYCEVGYYKGRSIMAIPSPKNMTSAIILGAVRFGAVFGHALKR